MEVILEDMKVWISLHSSYLESSFTGSLRPLLSYRKGHILWFGKILKAFPIIVTSKYSFGGVSATVRIVLQVRKEVFSQICEPFPRQVR